MAADTRNVIPGQRLGVFYLGASLYEVLTIIRNDRSTYPNVDFVFDKKQPLEIPSVVSLPQQGLRFRFDGPDQRLRLIEVMDFKKARVAYKDSEIMKGSESELFPSFKRIYQLFGPTYEGEYARGSDDGSGNGIYMLSWEGVAFGFPLSRSVYSPDKDFVSLLSYATATRMAVFEGGSWQDMRKDLFTRAPIGPRTSALARSRDSIPCELELAMIKGEGTIEFVRRGHATSFSIRIDETHVQDLITWLGPPDAKHKVGLQSERHDTPTGPTRKRTGSSTHATTNGRAALAGSQPSSYSSTNTDTYDVDFDSGDIEDDAADSAAREEFWCYFNHGMDILIGPSTPFSFALPSPISDGGVASSSPHLVVRKVIIHGNIPGSYAFNRHRRLRWQLALPNTEFAGDLTSETPFRDLNQALMFFCKGGPEMSKGKVVNRTWGAGASDSSFFLPDAEQDLVEGSGSEQWIGNTKVYTFPGMVLEVLDSDVVSALTVC